LRSLSISTTNHSTIQRRFIPDALEMLDTKNQYAESKMNVLSLENRIKRLMFEEERAKKLTQLATEKAEKLL
jgi:hypothetical protein